VEGKGSVGHCKCVGRKAKSLRSTTNLGNTTNLGLGQPRTATDGRVMA